MANAIIHGLMTLLSQIQVNATMLGSHSKGTTQLQAPVALAQLPHSTLSLLPLSKVTA